MPRRKTPFVAGEYYHLYNRGNNRATIFPLATDYLRFTQCIEKYLLPVADLLAYCLMPTHYHFLVQLRMDSHASPSPDPGNGLSNSMMRLSVSYTKWFNRAHGRTGVLFEGSFGSKLIRSDEQLLAVTNYIHDNPVEAGLVEDPGDWSYSSFHAYTHADRENFVVVDHVMDVLPTGTDYGRYLMDLRGPSSDLGGPEAQRPVS